MNQPGSAASSPRPSGFIWPIIQLENGVLLCGTEISVIFSRFDYLKLWSRMHLPASEEITRDGSLTRWISVNRNRGKGYTGLFFDGRADWLDNEDNIARFWCSAELIWVLSMQ